MRPWGVLVALLVLTAGAAARAEEATLWQETLEPCLTEVRGQRRNLWALLGTGADRPGWLWGLTQANEAVRRCPNDAELRFLRGRMLYHLDRWEESVEEYHESIRLDPDGPLAAEAAFDLGVTLTRLGRFSEAAEAYRAFLDESPWPLARSIALTNLAETLMAEGLLQESLGAFRAAVSAEPRYSLAYFGLAVILDRLGEETEALSVMLHGLSVGSGIEQLNDPGVFYVPDCEIHYYRALAYEALGQLSMARTQWQLYLSEGGAAEPFAGRARAHLGRLDEGAR